MTPAAHLIFNLLSPWDLGGNNKPIININPINFSLSLSNHKLGFNFLFRRTTLSIDDPKKIGELEQAETDRSRDGDDIEG